jgi:putative aminopeptidase FrvX
MMPTIGNAQLKLLERLCNACGVSGDEGEVRAIVLEEIKGHADEVRVDALGNVLAIKNGSRDQRLRIMLSAHMDEVGFMLVADEGEGLFRFETVGGIDLRQLPGKAVLVGQEHVPGVIGARPIHLTTSEERRQKIPLDALRIDVGPGTTKVKPGERATFATRFQHSSPSISLTSAVGTGASRTSPAMMAKALDDRLGVATLIELLRHPPVGIDLLAAFTVQEEIGLRGAKVAAYSLKPDLGIAVDATPAYDLPDWEGEENTSYNTKLGFGPAIYSADGATLSDPRLVRWLVRTAEAAKIPYQLRQPGGGGTDAGAIQKAREGVPSISVSVPHRYSHTAISVARLEDWKNSLTLLQTALGNITPELLASERA